MSQRLAEDQAARRAWAVPRATGSLGSIELRYLDPANPDDRYFLILSEHPELREAIERDFDEMEIDGNVFNPRLHLVMHEVVANQLWSGEPPEVWQTARRLEGLGYERHEILHMLGSVAVEHIWEVLKEGRRYDHARYVAALAALPDSWESLQRPPHPPHRSDARRRGRRRAASRTGRRG